MGVVDAPQWLIPAFVRSVVAAGGSAPPEQIEEVGTALLDRWNHPSRAFHTVKHLIAVLARVDEFAEEIHHPDLVRLAAWYHSAAFRPAAALSKDSSEAESALIARTQLQALGVPDRYAGRVRDLILALARHLPPTGDPDAAALSDADFGILAAEPQAYQDYVAKVRAENAHLPRTVFLTGRINFVTALLARPRIYHSPKAAAWEDGARHNLTAELARLKKDLAAAGPVLPAD